MNAEMAERTAELFASFAENSRTAPVVVVGIRWARRELAEYVIRPDLLGDDRAEAEEIGRQMLEEPLDGRWRDLGDGLFVRLCAWAATS